ncbi:MAG: hypothetical protein LBH77_06265 [Tannerella sp.]|jgi:hypothetical protein|nr:hypothetical protein [Tannerella sp.]
MNRNVVEKAFIWGWMNLCELMYEPYSGFRKTFGGQYPYLNKKGEQMSFPAKAGFKTNEAVDVCRDIAACRQIRTNLYGKKKNQNSIPWLWQNLQTF